MDSFSQGLCRACACYPHSSPLAPHESNAIVADTLSSIDPKSNIARKVVEEEIEDEESEEEAATGEEKETFRNQMIAAVIIKIHFELSVFYASYHLKCRNVSPVYMIYFDHMYQSKYFL